MRYTSEMHACLHLTRCSQVRLLQSVVHELQEKLKERDAIIADLQVINTTTRTSKGTDPADQAQLSLGQADPFTIPHVPNYTGRNSVTFVQKPVRIAIEGTRDVGHTEYKLVVTMNDHQTRTVMKNRCDYFV